MAELESCVGGADRLHGPGNFSDQAGICDHTNGGRGVHDGLPGPGLLLAVRPLLQPSGAASRLAMCLEEELLKQAFELQILSALRKEQGTSERW